MPESDQSFADLMDRVCGGDHQAAEQLIRSYESDLRIMARVHLTDPKLRRLMDSMDICQSIQANFFVRAASGQFDIQTPAQLRALLAKMTRNKVTDHARRQTAHRRGRGQVGSLDRDPIDPASSPSSVVAQAELLGLVYQELNDEERRITDLRAQGHDWHEIAVEIGASAEAVRKRFSRAMDRVVGALSLNE